MNNIIKSAFVIICIIFCLGCGSHPEPINSAIDKPVIRPVADKLSVKEEASVKSPLTLKEAISHMESNNRELKSLRAKIKGAGAEVEQMKLLPNPSLSAELSHVPTKDLKTSEGIESVGISQQIETGGKREARVNLAKEKMDASSLIYKQRKSEMVLELTKTFNAVMLEQKELALTKEIFDIESKLFEIAKLSSEQGRLSQTEFLETEIRLSRSKLDLQSKEEGVRNKISDLRKLLSVNESAKLRFSDKLSPIIIETDISKLNETMLANNPQIQLAQKAIIISDKQLAKDLAGRIPDLKIGIGYMKDKKINENMVGVNIELPLPIFSRNQGKIASAKADSIYAGEQSELLKNNLSLMLSQVVTTYNFLKENLSIYQDKILPNSEKNFSVAGESYTSGKISHQELLSAHLKLINANMEYWKLIKMLNDFAAGIDYLCANE